MDDVSRYVPRDEGQRYEELRELYRPSIASRMEEILEELWEDPQFFAEVKERFEKGRRRGIYPALERDLGQLPDEKRDKFLVVGGHSAIRSFVPREEQPWDKSPFDGSVDAYLEELYGGMAYTYYNDLRDFAQRWLDELSRVGYRGVTTIFGQDGVFYIPSKQPTDNMSAVTRPLGAREKAHPVTFENSRQVLWLQLEGDRSLDHGYREVRVSDEPLRTDKAILAALTAMEGRTVDTDRLRSALDKLKLPLEEPMWRQLDEALKEIPVPPYDRSQSIAEDLEQMRKQREESELVSGLQGAWFLDYVLLLLRYHRPEFDSLPEKEKLDLIAQTCAYTNTFMEALRKLTDFLEYGVPGRRQKAAAIDADRDVRAAVRKDVDGLTYREISRELGIPLPKDVAYKGDHPRVRQMVNRGRSLLERTLGKEGWQDHIEAMKAEAKRWKALGEIEQSAEGMSESLGIPYEEALRIEKEQAGRRQERRSEHMSDTD
jgi:hypothetical protein